MTVEHLQATILAAAGAQTPLSIRGGNSKQFYGRACSGEPLSIAEHQGIVTYEPSELVITARAGTPLATIEATLAEQGQCLAFEPPHFGEHATWGGCIACGLSGPARPYQGAVRDFVLGVRCLNGKGELLRFGGQVMKNVAGYDISRLMVGALGTLGVLLEISCKVLPKAAEEVTLVMNTTLEQALEHMQYWGNQNIPLTASCFEGDRLLLLRLAGSHIQSEMAKIPAEKMHDGPQFWTDLREHKLAFFAGESPPLWRLSLPIGTPHLALEGSWLIEWGGALRWLRSDLPAQIIRQHVAQAGGHATLFRGGDRHSAVFHPLPAALDKLHQRLKMQFDPQAILNPQRLAVDW